MVSAERARAWGQSEGERRKGGREGAGGWMGGGDGLGDGGQPLLSASISEPRGDMGAGKTEGIKGGGGGGGGEVRAGSRPLTSHPSALQCTCLLSHTPHHLLPSPPLPFPLHLFSVQMCNAAAAGFLNIFFFTGPRQFSCAHLPL